MQNFRYHKKRYTLILSFILLLVFFVLYRLGIFENKALKSAMYWEQQGRNRVADTLERAIADTKVTEEAQPNSAVRIEEEKLPGGDSSNMFYIIIGSFINSENANLVARQYSSQGYSTSIITTTNRNGKKAELVSVKTFNNHDEAVKYLKEFQSKVDPKAWIYPNS